MLSKASLIKPVLTTKFHVDLDWWKSQDRNWRNSLVTFMCPAHQEIFSASTDDEEMDLVDPETGVVTRGDGLIQTLIDHCAKQADFISLNAPLRSGLANRLRQSCVQSEQLVFIKVSDLLDPFGKRV